MRRDVERVKRASIERVRRGVYWVVLGDYSVEMLASRSDAEALRRAVSVVVSAAGGVPMVGGDRSRAARWLGYFMRCWRGLPDERLDGLGRLRAMPRSWARVEPLVHHVVETLRREERGGDYRGSEWSE